MTFATIITARSSSKRLENKILLDISKNYKCVDILIERSKLVGLPIILATSIAKSDDKLVRYVKNNHKIIIFRGSLNNKVKRWYNCFTKYNLTSACFIDGDDLLFDYNLYKKNFIKAKKISRPYMLKNPKNIVTGAFTYIINFKFLEKIYKKSQKVKDVDVIEGFCKNINKIENIKLEKTLVDKKIRLTLDYTDDYIFFKKIFKIFNPYSSTREVIKYLEKHSELTKINFFLNKSWKLNQLKQKENF